MNYWTIEVIIARSREVPEPVESFLKTAESTATAAELPNLIIRCVGSMKEIDHAAWDRLDHGSSPFLKSGFLRALELTGSIGVGSGWQPCYLLAEVPSATASGDDESGELVGAVPAFIKSHSYGEYIFDWRWAGAAERAGIPYYPKLVVAAPVTPATGNRILLAPGVDVEFVTAALVAGLKEIADRTECSSIHWLFCTEDESKRLAAMGFAPRATFQFHWHNRGYETYEDFLASLTSRKRKQLRKERRRALAAVDGPVEFVAGREIDKARLAAMDRYYRRTVFAHGGIDYLRPGFFHRLHELAPELLLFAEARRGGKPVAGAIYLETEKGLYGRYWGCDEEIEFLHFETAYYAGIERCIERGIPLFEAGAQGEHKLLRGFMPSPTHSCHWIRHPGLHAGISEFLEHDRRMTEARMARLAECCPYKQC